MSGALDPHALLDMDCTHLKRVCLPLARRICFAPAEGSQKVSGGPISPYWRLHRPYIPPSLPISLPLIPKLKVQDYEEKLKQDWSWLELLFFFPFKLMLVIALLVADSVEVTLNK